MANPKSQQYEIIKNGPLCLDKFCADINPFGQGFNKKNSPLLGGAISNVFKKTEEKEVIIKKHVIIGSGSTILPGSTLNEGVAVGAMSMVKGISEAWMIYAGIPAKAINARRKDIIEEYERQYLNSIK